MILFVNGQFVDEEKATVSVFDRGFLYGDGLFETLLVRNAHPFRWEQHFARLAQGAEYLGLKLPFNAIEGARTVEQLLARNQIADAVLRLAVSRGIGSRGYSPKGAGPPTIVMSLHPAPPRDTAAPAWRVITSRLRLPAGDPLTRFKTSNKLVQVLARAEADAAGADEALLLNTQGEVVEGSSGNVFWIETETICTPPLESGALPGVTRAVVLEICARVGWCVAEKQIRLEQFAQTAGVFFTLSSLGIAEAVALDGKPLQRSSMIDKLRRAYLELVEQETRNRI